MKFKVESNLLMLEMARIGDMGEYSIYVRSNDNGNLPHFHIVDSNTLGNNFHTCIQILDNAYFFHTGKEDKLNSKGRRDLIEFLLAPDEDGVFESNWVHLVYEWNKNNNRRKIDKNSPMPDYRIMKENKK